MKFRILIIFIALLSSTKVYGQQFGRGFYGQSEEVDKNGDTTIVINLLPIYVFARPADMRKYARLVYNVKRVYPIALEAQNKLIEMEQKLATIKSPKEQKQYIKSVENELMAHYTPILKKMSFSQGKVLIKLIDRQTNSTSYELVKEMRGNFSAFFWQGIAKMFGANLKEGYDKQGEDKIIEQIIIMYEAGLI